MKVAKYSKGDYELTIESSNPYEFKVFARDDRHLVVMFSSHETVKEAMEQYNAMIAALEKRGEPYSADDVLHPRLRITDEHRNRYDQRKKEDKS